jgi:hypothetical protein
MDTSDNAAFPPPGWMTNREAARQLGVALDSMTCSGWKWRAMLREVGKCVRMPGGGRCNIYSVEGIERIKAARAVAAIGPAIPEGYVDKDGACAMFGVDGKTKRLGRFGDQMAAAVAYDEAATQYFGEHARLNFPDGVDAWLEKEGFTPGRLKAA